LKPVETQWLASDPLGRDTRNFEAFVLEIVEHALSRRDREAIDAEIAAVEKRLGISKSAAPLSA